MLAHTLSISRQALLKQLIIHPELCLTAEQKKNYISLIQRRKKGEPVAYLVGSKEFFGRNFTVTNNTLIPRPETELLVEQALNRIDQNSSVYFADLGTGSGCIGITIALEKPYSYGVLIDKSYEAMKIADQNRRIFQCKNIQTLLADFDTPPLVEGSLSLVVSNPPYVSRPEYDEVSNEVKDFEPKNALIPRESSPKGLEDLFSIACTTKKLLMPKGWLLMEMGYTQGNEIKHFLQEKGWINVSIVKDLAGLDRVVCAQNI